MTSVKLTNDGYSYHTPGLKVSLDSKGFNKVLESLYDAAKSSKHTRTYALTSYQSPLRKPYCSTVLSPFGILLYPTDTIKNGWHKYTVKAVVNPRRVLDPKSGYLGIAPPDSDSLERFSDKFTLLMRKYHLPEFLDEWTLTRLDLCVNLQLGKKKSAGELCRLLQKDLLPPKLERVYFFDPDADENAQKKQKGRDRHSLCLANRSYEIVVYDKLFQLKTDGHDESANWAKLRDGILRLELRCLQPYLHKLAVEKNLNSTTEQIKWMAQHSRELILKKATKAFSGGTHYKPDAAKALIEASDYHQETQTQLWRLFKRMRYPFDLEQLEKWMKKQFDLKPRTVNKRLAQLQELGINLVPLRKDFYLNQLPSLPLILELLEDDSTTLKFMTDGSVVY